MKLENPWIAAACDSHSVAPNRLGTFLQEQYGQLGEDLILEAVLKSILARTGRQTRSLRYLEVGANHPIQTSNTYLFYRKWGARGVLVEANPRLIDTLRQVRKDDVILNRAVAPAGHGPEAELVVAEHSELSSIDAGHVASFGANGRVAAKVRVPTLLLDELIDRHFADGLDLLSIDIEGLDLQVLREARLAVRPACIVAEPSRHYQQDAEQRFAEVLGAKRYVEVARTDYNLIYMDQDRLPAGGRRPTIERMIVRTFDIFDTLIARHCIRPAAVFEAVELRRQAPGFAAARGAAERAVEHGEYTILDIYRELQSRGQYTDDRLQELMAAELEEELANVVPIADNIARIGADSVLVTDMYLPPDAIRALLKAGGIPPELPIVQTSHGKRSGRIWTAFADAGVECHHVGDSRQADYDTCLAGGMRPVLHQIALPTPTEQRLLDAGLTHFPQALRSARLMSGTSGLTPEQRRLQFEFNLPLLTVFAALVRQHAQAHGLQRVLFAARDGLHLKLLYDAVASAFGGGVPSVYWHTSRVARTAGDPQYIDYCRSLIDPRALVVDLCGTGASLLRLYADLGCTEPAPPTVLCQKLDDAALAQAFARDYRLRADARLDALHVIDGGFCPNEDLEMLNYVPHGMLVGVTRLGSEWLPLRAAYEFDEPLRSLVERQHEAVSRAADHLAKVLSPGAAAEIESRGAQILQCLHAVAADLEPQRRALRGVFLEPHRAFELHTRRRLAQARKD